MSKREQKAQRTQCVSPNSPFATLCLSVGTSSQMGYKIQEAQFLMEFLPEKKSSADKFG